MGSFLLESAWLPWYLGGKGELRNCFKGAPWVKPEPGAVDYALVQLGYHIGDTIGHLIIDDKHNDYMEFLLHHVCAFSLVLCMLISNELGVGVLVLWSHAI